MGSEKLEKIRNSLSPIENMKFIIFISLNISNIIEHRFSKKVSKQKGSIVKGFYNSLLNYLNQSSQHVTHKRSTANLRAHIF